MQVVLDTNVLVSGLLSPAGACSSVLDLLIEGAFDACWDPRMLVEYTAVLHRPELSLPPQEVAELLNFLTTTGHRITPHPLSVMLPDPDDLAFLETARAASAILVTGNKRHFPPAVRGGVEVMSPREFLTSIAAGD